jgi:hypothetical protein
MTIPCGLTNARAVILAGRTFYSRGTNKTVPRMGVENPYIGMDPNAAKAAPILDACRHIEHPTRMAPKNGTGGNKDVFRNKYTTLRNPRSP